MATPQRPGGYVDRELLERAVGRNAAAREILGRLAPLAARGDSRLAAGMLELATVLGSQLETLAAMRLIRGQTVARSETGHSEVGETVARSETGHSVVGEMVARSETGHSQ